MPYGWAYKVCLLCNKSKNVKGMKQVFSPNGHPYGWICATYNKKAEVTGTVVIETD